MKFEKSASILFLCFSILVGFSNIFIGEYQYCLFIIPFAVSIFLSGKIETYVESIGLVLIATYLVYCQNVYIGLMLMTISTVITFGTHKTIWTVRGQIIISGVIVFSASFLNKNEIENQYIRAAKDCGMYLICALAIHNKFYYFMKLLKRKEKPLDQKYLDVLDELTSVAHESIDTLKKLQDGKK